MQSGFAEVDKEFAQFKGVLIQLTDGTRDLHLTLSRHEHRFLLDSRRTQPGSIFSEAGHFNNVIGGQRIKFYALEDGACALHDDKNTQNRHQLGVIVAIDFNCRNGSFHLVINRYG